MKILFIEWGCLGKEDVEEALKAEGHDLVYFPIGRGGGDPETEGMLVSALNREAPDVVFSIDYFPEVSNVCRGKAIRYISWIFRMPCVKLYSQTVLNPFAKSGKAANICSNRLFSSKYNPPIKETSKSGACAPCPATMVSKRSTLAASGR